MQFCYFCGHSKFKEIKLPATDGIFYECRKCSLIHLSASDRLEDEKKHYSSVYYDSEYSGRKNIAEAFYYRLPIISKYLQKGAKVLEVGAASGDFLAVLKKEGYEISGVELSARAVLKARENYGISITEGTLARAYFNHDFDALLMYHVLEHVADPRTLLAEAYRKITEGGIIIIEVPNPRSIDRFSKRLLSSILDYPNHVYAFPPRVLKKMLSEAGFEVIYEQKSFSYLIASMFGQSRKPKVFIERSENLPPSAQKDGFDITSIPKRNFLKELASRILPGMKYTVVARKK